MNTAYASSPQVGAVAGEATLELARLLELIITKIPLWIAAIIVIFLTLIAAKILRGIVENKLAESGVEEDHKELQILGGRMTSVTVLVIGITVALKIAGIDLTAIIAAVGFGIGFALKDLIMNFLAGVMIILGRHFSIGDFINIDGVLGKVVEIQSRVTILQAIDGTKVIVPNADIFSKQVTSYTSNPFRRIEVEVNVDHRTNLENAIRVALDAVKKTHGIVLEPKPAVVVSDFAESSIVLKVKAWVESRSGWIATKSRMITNIKTNFDEYGITIPWPIHTVAYDKDHKFEEKLLAAEPHAEATAKATAAPVQPHPVATAAPAEKPEDEDSQQPLRPLAEKR